MHGRSAPMRYNASLWIFVALCLLAGLTLAPVAVQPGWPMNHEFNLPWSFNSFYLRTEIYAAHMQQGDLFPIWSAADNVGFGSPQPLMYHKLFYLVSGAFYALSGQMKASILLALWVFLIVGATGTFRLCRSLDCGIYISACGAALLILANYTVTNWLIRGAMAEFSAAMLVPWVLATFVDWLHAPTSEPYKQLGLLGLLLGLVFLAHSVLAFYLVLLLAVAFLSLTLLRATPLRAIQLGPTITGAVVFAVITAPYLAAMRTIGAAYDMTRIIPAPFLPENQIKPWLNYLWDAQWVWGKVWDSYTVQLDLPVLFLFAAGGVLLGFRWISTRGKTGSAPATKTANTGALALGIIVVLCLLLQTTWAIPFYRHVPGAAFIQFPWRLLAVLTPSLIALALYPWQRINTTWSAIGPGACVVAALTLCGAWASLMYGNTPHEKAAQGEFRFGAFGEYIPAQAGIEPPYRFESVQALLAAEGCQLRSPATASASESLETAYELDCSKPGTYALPLFGSPLHQLWVTSKENGTTHEGCAVAAQTPGLCAVTLTKPGVYRILVQMPTFRGWASRFAQ